MRLFKPKAGAAGTAGCDEEKELQDEKDMGGGGE